MSQQRRVPLPIIGGTAESQSVQVNNQLTLNLTATPTDRGKGAFVLRSTPGLSPLAEVPDAGPCRTPRMQSWVHPTFGTEDAYGVYGSKLARYTPDGGVEVIGTLGTSSGFVSIARGRSYLLIVDGEQGYTYDGTTFALITDAGFPSITSSAAGRPTHAAYLDGFFIVNDSTNDNFHISPVEDPTTWNALDFAAAAVAPDRALAVANNESALWIVGDETCQAFYNNGGTDFPFTIQLSATMEVGIAAPFTLAESDDGFFFVATTPEGGSFVWRIQGAQGVMVSTDEVNEVIRRSNLDEAFGYFYKQGGRSYYCLHLTDDQHTLVYNLSAGIWESRGRSDGGAWRVGGHVAIKRRNICADRGGGRLFELSEDVVTEDGQPVTRLRRTQIYHEVDHLLEYWEIVVDGESATTQSAGADPVVRLRFSDDGGVEWSFWLEQPLGKIGERLRRATFGPTGQGRARIYEISYSEPAPVAISAMYARLEVLRD